MSSGTGMKEIQLREHLVCSVCGKPVGSGLPVFWTVKLEQHGIDVNAVRRQTGLTMLLGGSAEIAYAMGPDEEMTKVITDEVELTVCHGCSTAAQPVVALMELIALAQEQERES